MVYTPYILCQHGSVRAVPIHTPTKPGTHYPEFQVICTPNHPLCICPTTVQRLIEQHREVLVFHFCGTKLNPVQVDLDISVNMPSCNRMVPGGWFLLAMVTVIEVTYDDPGYTHVGLELNPKGNSSIVTYLTFPP